jgi:hypothetical protein
MASWDSGRNKIKSRLEVAHNTKSYTSVDGLIMIDHVDGVRLYLWTAATNGPTVHPPGDIWAWENHGEVIMSMEENSRLFHQSSLAILRTDSSGSK